MVSKRFLKRILNSWAKAVHKIFIESFLLSIEQIKRFFFHFMNKIKSSFNTRYAIAIINGLIATTDSEKSNDRTLMTDWDEILDQYRYIVFDVVFVVVVVIESSLAVVSVSQSHWNEKKKNNNIKHHMYAKRLFSTYCLLFSTRYILLYTLYAYNTYNSNNNKNIYARIRFTNLSVVSELNSCAKRNSLNEKKKNKTTKYTNCMQSKTGFGLRFILNSRNLSFSVRLVHIFYGCKFCALLTKRLQYIYNVYHTVKSLMPINVFVNVKFNSMKTYSLSEWIHLSAKRNSVIIDGHFWYVHRMTYEVRGSSHLWNKTREMGKKTCFFLVLELNIKRILRV